MSRLTVEQQQRRLPQTPEDRDCAEKSRFVYNLCIELELAEICDDEEAQAQCATCVNRSNFRLQQEGFEERYE